MTSTVSRTTPPAGVPYALLISILQSQFGATANDIEALQLGILSGITTAAAARTALGLVQATPITASLGADVALNNVANYFDGPSVAQGTSGTWFASGTVSLIDGAGAAAIRVKLWDGTTVIASTVISMSAINLVYAVSLSGLIAAPAGNIRISARDTSSISGRILANASTEAKDSTITATRIG